ncbi:MAG: 4-hydroxybenzoate octaprenyltransferase [Alphaproteobacteria bacterium]|nr:4-hydroxybenzoate octaprenyltransferase [Alphaproteobacteria bacterium]
MTQPFTDIRETGLIAALPERARPYARLMRLDRPIGTWLLLLPCWWGVALAAPLFPNLWFMLLFGLGAVVMRGAGCTINDIYDRELDARVERTRVRPLASGEVSLTQAVIFLAALLLVGFGILMLFNRATVVTGALSLLLVFTYPLMKRVTWWPQLFLGLTFNWGVLLGSTAVTGGIDPAHIVMYAAGVCWTLAYDTIYAHQDARDDAAVGIKSTALLFGEHSPRWVAIFYVLALLLLALAGWIAGLGRTYEWGLLAAGCFAAVQLTLWKPDEPEDCLKRFRANRNFGLIILAAIVLGKML